MARFLIKDNRIATWIFLKYEKMGLISNSYFDRIYQHESVQDLLLSGLSGTLGLEDGCITAAHVCKAKRLLKQVGLEDKLDYPYLVI